MDTDTEQKPTAPHTEPAMRVQNAYIPAPERARPAQCEVCGDAAASYKCQQCIQCICQTCHLLHRRFKETASHTVQHIEEALCAQTIQEAIAHLSQTESKLANETEETVRQQESVKTGMVKTQQEIRSFALAVQTRCDELHEAVEEAGQAMLASLQVWLHDIEEKKNSITTGMDKLRRLMESNAQDVGAIKQTLKPFIDESVSIGKLIAQKDQYRGEFELVFKSPPKEEIVQELSLAEDVESTTSRDDEVGESIQNNNTQQTIDDSDQEDNSDYEIMAEDAAALESIRNLRRRGDNHSNGHEPSFSQFAGRTLQQIANITKHYTCPFGIINGELWLLDVKEISVFSGSLKHERSIQIRVISSKKTGNNPRACAQNSNGSVFVAFDRPERDSRQQTINGIWMVQPAEGHAVLKLALGGFCNVTCCGTDVLGLSSDYSRVTIHRHTGDGIAGWTNSIIPLDIENPQASLLATNAAFYLVDDANLLVYNKGGDLIKVCPFPPTQNPQEDGEEPQEEGEEPQEEGEEPQEEGEEPQWHLCCIDAAGQIIACEQVSGLVYLCETERNTYTPIHFRAAEEVLDNPVQMIGDFAGNLFVREQTSYGDELSKFTLPVLASGK